MALKTREEWEAIVDAAATTAGLSTSAVDEYLLYRDTAVTLAMETETIQELTKQMVEFNNATKQPYSDPWYPVMVKEFQNGDSLLVNEYGVLYYAVVDTDLQIVKVCTVTATEDGSRKIIKVAKDDGAGGLEELTIGEKSDLDDYLDARIPSDVPYQLVSIAPDEVTYTMTCRYNPRYNKADVETAIGAALTAFRDNLPFDAIFYKSQLIAAIEAVDGVDSVLVQIDMSLNAGTTTVTDLVEFQALPAGYFIWDTGASSLTMIAI